MTEPTDPYAAFEQEMAEVAADVESMAQVARQLAFEAGITSERALDLFEQGFMAWEPNSLVPQGDPLMIAGWFYHRGLSVGYTVGLAADQPPEEEPNPPPTGQAAADGPADRTEPEEDEPE